MPLYLTFLAVSDILVLYSGLLRQWIIYMFDVDVRDLHPALCKVNTWLVYVSLDLSAWILVSVTIERALLVWYPLTAKVMCTTKTVTVNMIVVCFSLLGINSHFFLLCGTETEIYDYFLEYVFPWIDLCLFSIGPFLFHIVGNTFIIIRLVTGIRIMAQLHMASNERAVMRQRQVTSMTVMLLSLNLVYLVCTLPISMYLVSLIYWEKDESPEADAQRRLVYACVNLLMYLNNSTNFITYTFSGRQFRMEFYALFCN
ncbi:sex peptide receptor-like [Haliotis rufescens]|uniref:sex peptide receptor-like n=1 Tax=Haliotis rufescens TaxID=6454 RepID=UPI001EAFEFB1|nr:sex peptide receptor-like [Haliotis rufescens]